MAETQGETEAGDVRGVEAVAEAETLAGRGWLLGELGLSFAAATLGA